MTTATAVQLLLLLSYNSHNGCLLFQAMRYLSWVLYPSWVAVIIYTLVYNFQERLAFSRQHSHYLRLFLEKEHESTVRIAAYKNIEDIIYKKKSKNRQPAQAVP